MPVHGYTSMLFAWRDPLGDTQSATQAIRMGEGEGRGKGGEEVKSIKLPKGVRVLRHIKTYRNTLRL